jgi:oligopeptide/dipeptide ABC transporter ATP-binding protein
VRALLAEPFRIHGVADRDLDAEVERLLGLVGLPRGFADRLPHQLSGGQARRVGVARAIALSPKLVIADEPTAGLDVSVQGEVLNLLNDLRETLGLAMLIITHNLNVVRHVADRMAIMYLGRFVEVGTTEAIFAGPRHPYGLALLSANPEPDPDAQPQRISLEGEVPSLLDRPSGCEFHGRCPFARERCRVEAPAVTVDPEGRLFTCHYPRTSEDLVKYRPTLATFFPLLALFRETPGRIVVLVSKEFLSHRQWAQAIPPPAAGRSPRMSPIFLAIVVWLIVQLPLAVLVGTLIHYAGQSYRLPAYRQPVPRLSARRLQAGKLRSTPAIRSW